MLVCYTRIAHNLTQATVCCGESAGQFTCVGARVSRGPEQSGSCALVRCTSRAAKKLHVTNGLRDQSGGSPLKRACSACMEPLQPGHTAAAERATAATVATATTAVAPSPPLPPAPAPLPPAATAVAATAIVATTASAAPLTGTLIGTLIGPPPPPLSPPPPQPPSPLDDEHPSRFRVPPPSGRGLGMCYARRTRCGGRRAHRRRRRDGISSPSPSPSPHMCSLCAWKCTLRAKRIFGARPQTLGTHL